MIFDWRTSTLYEAMYKRNTEVPKNHVINDYYFAENLHERIT